MKRSDIGPFGVVALLFTLLIQVAALTAAPHPAAALVVSAAAGRLAITWACTPGVPAARPDGLGATVAGTVPLASAAALTVALLLASTAALPWLAAPAVLGGLTAAHLFRRHLTRRLGGVTGDVLGSLTELTATTTLVILTLG